MSDEFTLEKLRIAEKLDNITASIAAFNESHKNIAKMLEKHDTTLYGDGNGKAGMSVRVDRLEQDFDNRKLHIRTLWAAFIGICVKLVHLSFK